jgi:hypothetical protein
MRAALIPIALAALALVPAARAQVTPLLSEVSHQNRTPLAATAEVEEGFALFVTDSVARALYNPARLPGLGSSFVYATVNPIRPTPYVCDLRRTCYSVGPTGEHTGVAASFRSGALTWLAQVDYAGASRTEDLDTRQSITPLDTTRSGRDQAVRTEAESHRHDVAVRLVAARQAGRTGYALGLFGGFETSRNEETNQVASRTDLSVVQDDLFLRETLQDERTLVDQQAWSTGLEVGIAAPRLDLVGALAYERHTNRYRADRTTASFDRMQVSYTEARVIDERSEQQGEGEHTLNGASAALAAAFYLADGPTADAVLLEASASGGAGPTRSAAAVSTVRRSFRAPLDDLEDLMLESEQEDELVFDDASLDGRAYRAGLALGYVHRRQVESVYLAFGVRAEGEGEEVTDLAWPFRDRDRWPYLTPFTAPYVLDPSAREAFRSASSSYWHAGLALPLYAEAPVYRALRLFGGGVFAYHYERGAYDYAIRSSNDASNSPVTYEEIEMVRDESVSAFRSHERLFLGARLRTASGLAAQAAFRGSLSGFSGWTVSLGYHF